MAANITHFNRSYVANADLTTAQYKLVKIVAGSVPTIGLCTAATDTPIGVLQNNPNVGEAATVAVIGLSKVVAGGILAPGDLIGVDATSRAVKLTLPAATSFIIGQVEQAAAAAGQVASAVINAAAPARGA